MQADVKAYGKKCEICQQRSEPRRLYGKLEPITLPAPGEMVTIDFAGPFTETDDKNTHILVVVDNGSKEAFLQATKGVTAEVAARGLVDKYVTQKGAPRVIASDRGSAFISAAMKSISDALGMKQQFSVAYHPQSHGQVENCIKTVERALQALVSGHQRDWDKHLLRVEAAIRFSPNETTGVSPFALQYGREAFLPIDRVMGAASNAGVNTAHPAVKDLHEDIEATLKAVGENVKKAQETQKKHFDKNHKDVDSLMDVGQQVLMRKRTVDFAGTSVKLQRPWAGPYRVIEKISNLNRVIQHVNNPEQRITVHVSQLKPFAASPDSENTPRHDEQLEVQEIVGERRHEGKTEYRVRWAGHTKRHDSWVAEEDMGADELLQRWKQRALEKRTAEAAHPSPRRGKKGKKRVTWKEDQPVPSEKEKKKLGTPLELPKKDKSGDPPPTKTTSHGRQVRTPGRYRYSDVGMAWLRDEPGK